MEWNWKSNLEREKKNSANTETNFFFSFLYPHLSWLVQHWVDLTNPFSINLGKLRLVISFCFISTKGHFFSLKIFQVKQIVQGSSRLKSEKTKELLWEPNNNILPFFFSFEIVAALLSFITVAQRMKNVKVASFFFFCTFFFLLCFHSVLLLEICRNHTWLKFFFFLLGKI